MARTGKCLSAITSKGDASCILNKRRGARKAKTKSNKRDRQNLNKELVEIINDPN